MNPGDRKGRVCLRHEEWCADGVCRWCEPQRLDLEFVDPGAMITGIDFVAPQPAPPAAAPVLTHRWRWSIYRRGNECIDCGTPETRTNTRQVCPALSQALAKATGP